MCNILNVMSNHISLQSCQIVFAVGIPYLACIFVYFNCIFVNQLVFYHSVVLLYIFYCTVLLCNLAQEFPSGWIKFYSILWHVIIQISFVDPLVERCNFSFFTFLTRLRRKTAEDVTCSSWRILLPRRRRSHSEFSRHNAAVLPFSPEI